MIRNAFRIAVLAAALAPFAARSEPITLKAAFFTSDRSVSFRAAVKPFVDAVNSEGKGLVEIVSYSGGILGRDIAQQPKTVSDGTADIAFLVPAYTANLFPDNPIVELPGMYHDAREASLVYTRLIARNALKGYEDYFVIGAYVTAPETIHSRPRITAISDLKGKKIRVNNAMEGAALEQLGATAVPTPILKVTSGIISGELDAASVSLAPLADYGTKRVTTFHYMLATSGAPLLLLMNRKKFESLPKSVQDIIRKYSGEWTAIRFAETYMTFDSEELEKLKAEPTRSVVFPSPQDQARANQAFDAVIREWLGEDRHHHELLAQAKIEIDKIRSGR
jgi:TRAP-type C4-dicarboxylate transport system substrate-binding protein